MRFQVSRVMDTIEQRLTTDVIWAQAVVDFGQVARHAALDGGRPVNLIRIGMVVDALSRYLVDEGAMLYGVIGRELLSESALTSKERMVLSRWADDGLIEVTPEVGDRVVEIADLTGLPLIALRPAPDLVKRFPWLDDDAGRVLRLRCRDGVAALVPSDIRVDTPGSVTPAVGRAKVPEGQEPSAKGSESDEAALPLPVEVFLGGQAAKLSRTVLARHRFVRAQPAAAGVPLLARQWRCGGMECPSFGDHRRIGQPVPRLHQGVPVCPRHGEPVVDVGPRPTEYSVSISVHDLPRQRLVVRAGHHVQVGRAVNDPDVVPVARWLHTSAMAWISPIHLRLEVRDGQLVVIDTSENGSVVWQRSGPGDPGTTKRLHRGSHVLGEWDSVELYTGIEVVRGDRRIAAALGRDDISSVLVDAPTAAHRHL